MRSVGAGRHVAAEPERGNGGDPSVVGSDRIDGHRFGERALDLSIDAPVE